MPELPEVETVRRGLQPVMEGRRILRAETRRPDLRFPFPERFGERLTGRSVVKLGRRAKYLLAELEDATALVMHLGMSGSFRVERPEDAARAAIGEAAFHHARSKDGRHDHVVLTLEDGTRIVYNDPRRFGFMTLADLAGIDRHPLFRRLGLEPVGEALDAQALAARLKGKEAPLKAALLDQTIVAGLGNIYVCEALWRAGLSPRRAAGTLVSNDGRPTARLERLVLAIRAVIADAIEVGGSTLRDHAGVDGVLGAFQHRFSADDREREPCPRPGCRGTVRRIVQSGRSTFFCPECQR